jgi:hypothetical protein
MRNPHKKEATMGIGWYWMILVKYWKLLDPRKAENFNKDAPGPQGGRFAQIFNLFSLQDDGS